MSSTSVTSSHAVQPDLQPDADTATPSGNDGSAVRCHRCGTAAAPGDRCAGCGSFLPGNEANLRHGLRRYETKGVLPADLKVSIDEFRERLVADQGGLAALTATRGGLCGLLVDYEIAKRLMLDQLVRHGVNSKAGGAAYDRLLSTMDRWLRIAATLGLERRQRHLNPLDAVREAVAEANR